MKALLQEIANEMNQALGHDLRGLYLYGSLTADYYQPGESDMNLLAVVREESDELAMCQAVRPVWQTYSSQLKQPPLLVKLSALMRHVHLFPNFGYHLAQNGRLLHGEPNLLGQLPDRSPAEFLSHLANAIMEASAALAPNLLPPAAAHAAEQNLRKLARRLLKRPIAPEETAVDLFAHIQQYLSRKIAFLSTTQLLPPPTPTTSPLPGLHAVYKKEMGRIVLVFNQLTIPQIQATDWTRIADQLTDRCAGLHATTTVQLRLLTKLESPLDMVFRRYTLDWGKDPLANLKPPRYYSLRHAARLPSEIAIKELPPTYLSAPDTEIGTIIHDFQNKLLNIQLEHEILHRLDYLERFAPDKPLPDRDAPAPERLRAIFYHLDQWSQFYYDMMKREAAAA